VVCPKTYRHDLFSVNFETKFVFLLLEKHFFPHKLPLECEFCCFFWEKREYFNSMTFKHRNTKPVTKIYEPWIWYWSDKHSKLIFACYGRSQDIGSCCPAARMVIALWASTDEGKANRGWHCPHISRAPAPHNGARRQRSGGTHIRLHPLQAVGDVGWEFVRNNCLQSHALSGVEWTVLVLTVQRCW